MTDKCPKCGAKLQSCGFKYDCMSPVQPDDLVRPSESKECLRRQLASAQAENERLTAERDEWRARSQKERAYGTRADKEVLVLRKMRERDTELLQRALKVIYALMPGACHIAVQDYSELNLVPCDIGERLTGEGSDGGA